LWCAPPRFVRALEAGLLRLAGRPAPGPA